MDLDAIYEYLDSPYLHVLRSADGEVVEQWEQTIERTLFAIYNNGEPLDNSERIRLFERGREEILRYEHAIDTEERDGLCGIFADMARLTEIVPPDELTIEDWAECHL